MQGNDQLIEPHLHLEGRMAAASPMEPLIPKKMPLQMPDPITENEK